MQSNLKKIDTSSVSSISFYLNSELITLDDVGANDTLLNFLRVKSRLTGTKEGCAEGDCGACTVLIGKIKAGNLEYKAVNACICLLPSLQSSHIVTIESLQKVDGELHPVQQAMVDSNGSQCGFCTPGIVMAVYAYWIKFAQFNTQSIEKMLQGNLCRCTGYGPIIKAAKSINNYGSPENDYLVKNIENMKSNLLALVEKKVKLGSKLDDQFIRPYSLDNFADLLKENSNATIVAGATDVGLWITKKLERRSPLIFIDHLEEIQKIEEKSKKIELGAGVTYSGLEVTLCKHFPRLNSYLSRIAGEQIRNVGTIGGNIANGSPIGDLAPLFIALGAHLFIRRGKKTRQIDVEKFFIDYGVQDIRKTELLEKIVFVKNPNLFLFPYKVSKRMDEDISTIAAVFSFEIAQGVLRNVRLAFGGMAGVPKRASTAEVVLEGRGFDKNVIKLAQLALEEDFNPISDMRASAGYRMRVAKNLLSKCYFEFHGKIANTAEMSNA